MSATNVPASTTVTVRPQVVFAILSDPSHCEIEHTLVNLKAAAGVRGRHRHQD